MRRALCGVIMFLVLLGSVSLVESACAKRHASTRRAFMRQTGYPNGRVGYIVDHIIPLACGGPDSVQNMQWQTIAAAKEKDKWERKLCIPCAAQTP